MDMKAGEEKGRKQHEEKLGRGVGTECYVFRLRPKFKVAKEKAGGEVA